MIPSYFIRNEGLLPLLLKKHALLLFRWFWIIFSYDTNRFYSPLCSPQYGFCSIRNLNIMNRSKCLTLTDGRTRTTSVTLHVLVHTQFMRIEWMQLILNLSLLQSKDRMMKKTHCKSILGCGTASTFHKTSTIHKLILTADMYYLNYLSVSFISIWKWSKIPRESIFWNTKYLLCRTANSGLQAHDSDFECVSTLHLLTVSAITLGKGKETRNYKQTKGMYLPCNTEQKTTTKTI